MTVRSPDTAARLVAIVVDTLDSEGYDAVQVRSIAARGRVSLTTIYKLFGNRDGMIVTAVSTWMADNAYANMPTPAEDEDPYEATVQVVRAIFAPWEEHPNMLAAFHRARTAPGGDALLTQGLAAVGGLGEVFSRTFDHHDVEDIQFIVGHVAHSAMTAFVAGAITVTDIVPILERTLSRLVRGPTPPP